MCYSNDSADPKLRKLGIKNYIIIINILFVSSFVVNERTGDGRE
jgi:hypothetical protein